MLRSLLVGLDGSEHSKAALALAIQWATRFDAMVVGLGVIDEPDICALEAVPLGAGYFKKHSDETRLARVRRQVDNFLGESAVRCAEAEVSFKELEDQGVPYEQIIREAERYDVILMGQETHFRFATHVGPCDTLKKVIRNAPRPVVVVPRNPGLGSCSLVAYDGSLQSARALLAFQASGLANFGEVHVVSVGEDHGTAARSAERAVDFLTQHDIAARPHVTTPAPSVAAALLEKAAQLQPGLIVMGAYGQPVLREFFLGSVTRTLLEKSTTPLFVYH